MGNSNPRFDWDVTQRHLRPFRAGLYKPRLWPVITQIPWLVRLCDPETSRGSFAMTTVLRGQTSVTKVPVDRKWRSTQSKRSSSTRPLRHAGIDHPGSCSIHRCGRPFLFAIPGDFPRAQSSAPPMSLNSPFHSRPPSEPSTIRSTCQHARLALCKNCV